MWTEKFGLTRDQYKKAASAQKAEVLEAKQGKAWIIRLSSPEFGVYQYAIHGDVKGRVFRESAGSVAYDLPMGKWVKDPDCLLFNAANDKWKKNT